MAEDSEARWHASLKAPAIEVVDLLSDDGDELIKNVLADRPKKRDASEDEGASEDESQWSDSQWSLYEDALEEESSNGAFFGSRFLRLPQSPTTI